MRKLIFGVVTAWLILAVVSIAQGPRPGGGSGGGGTTYTFNSPLSETGGTVTCPTCSVTAPGLVLLSPVCTASGAASCDFPSIFSSTYDSYRIDALGLVPATDNASLDLLVTDDNGSSYEATNYTSDISATGTAVASTTSILLSNSQDNASGASWSGEIKVSLPLSATLFKRFVVTGHGVGDVPRYYLGGGSWNTATALTGFQIKAGSGNISGTVRVYGIAK